MSVQHWIELLSDTEAPAALFGRPSVMPRGRFVDAGEPYPAIEVLETTEIPVSLAWDQTVVNASRGDKFATLRIGRLVVVDEDGEEVVELKREVLIDGVAEFDVDTTKCAACFRPFFKTEEPVFWRNPEGDGPVNAYHSRCLEDDD